MATEGQSQFAWVGSGDIRITQEGQQQKPAVTSLAGGGYVVAWIAYTFVEGLPIKPDRVHGTALRRQWCACHRRIPGRHRAGRGDSTGSPVGGILDIPVGFSTVIEPQVTALADGGLLVSWVVWTAGESPIMAQRYDSAGAAVGEPVLVGVASAALPHYSVSAKADGGAVFAWEDIRADGGDIFVELFSGAADGGGGPQGGNGTDNLVGTAGADMLFGGNGRDFLTGLGGDDVLDGGRGLDTAIYLGVMPEYTIARTEQGFTVSGPEGVDTLIGIERVRSRTPRWH